MSKNWKDFRTLFVEMFMRRAWVTNMKICFCIFEILLRNTDYSKSDNFTKLSGLLKSLVSYKKKCVYA